jgi:aldose 1-epimerase
MQTNSPDAQAGVVAALLLAGAASGAMAGSVTRTDFGATADGVRVERLTLANDRLEISIITYGAAIQAALVPGRDGTRADVALGYPTLEGYLVKSEYFGATVGRVANRIAAGRFELDGKSYHVPVNNGPNSLHGGTHGFDKKVWTVTDVRQGAAPRVTLRLVSPDGDQGYPGTVTATATYTLEGSRLSLEYRATTDRPTLVNLSNHAYWNLAGEGAASGAMDHLLTLDADAYMPTDATAIPTGEIRPVEGTVFDFRTPTAVGARVRDAGEEQIRFGRGYDHNWVVSRTAAPAPRRVARVEHPQSGRVMELFSDQPGLQFYSGNFMDGTVVGKAGKLYRQGDALVLEPQMHPDTPNRPAFGSVRLDPGQTYRNRIEFRFGTTPAQER